MIKTLQMSCTIKYAIKDEAYEACKQRSLNYYHKNKEKVRQKQKEYYNRNREIINQHKNAHALLNTQLWEAQQKSQSLTLEIVDEPCNIQIDPTQIDKLCQMGRIVRY